MFTYLRISTMLTTLQAVEKCKVQFLDNKWRISFGPLAFPPKNRFLTKIIVLYHRITNNNFLPHQSFDSSLVFSYTYIIPMRSNISDLYTWFGLACKKYTENKHNCESIHEKPIYWRELTIEWFKTADVVGGDRFKKENHYKLRMSTTFRFWVFFFVHLQVKQTTNS